MARATSPGVDDAALAPRVAELSLHGFESTGTSIEEALASVRSGRPVSAVTACSMNARTLPGDPSAIFLRSTHDRWHPMPTRCVSSSAFRRRALRETAPPLRFPDQCRLIAHRSDRYLSFRSSAGVNPVPRPITSASMIRCRMPQRARVGREIPVSAELDD